MPNADPLILSMGKLGPQSPLHLPTCVSKCFQTLSDTSFSDVCFGDGASAGDAMYFVLVASGEVGSGLKAKPPHEVPWNPWNPGVSRRFFGQLPCR